MSTLAKAAVEFEKEQFTTFSVAGRMYGIDVMKVQEVTRSMPVTGVPLAPDYVCGLINLRGQIATAISLRKLFRIPGDRPPDEMNVVCRIDGLLFSFLVDWIGDVTEVEADQREPAPATIDPGVRQFIDGICRLPNELLSVLNIDRVSEVIHAMSSDQRRGEKV
jgi:purine-binding chemotaxis protein CheW